MVSNRRRQLIIAGTEKEAMYCAAMNGLTRGEWANVFSRNQLTGVSKCEIWLYGTYYNRPEWRAMEYQLRANKCTFVNKQ